ncbi:hypothetical protein C8J57DRAFT_1507604 [Mycena rebaudengoi]|nr:hypothetical protein C8J57DRAFT_1507604 [Mycena rebaudengoi]
MDGSLCDLEEVADWLENKPKFQSLLALPVFFVNLDLSTMPDAAAMDVAELPSGSSTFDRISRAEEALDTLAFDHWAIKPSSGLDIWPRFWAWTIFIHTYKDQFPVAPSEVEISNVLRLMRFIAVVKGHKRSIALVSKTTGLRTLVVQTWVLLQATDCETRTSGFEQLAPFLRVHFKPPDSANLEEIIEGGGGSLEALAALVVNHLRVLNASAGAVESSATLTAYDAILPFILELDDQPDPLLGVHGPVCAAFLAHGIVPAITTGINVLAEVADRRSAIVIHNMLWYLKSRLYISPVSRWIAQSIETGLLRGIVLYAARGVGPKDPKMLTCARGGDGGKTGGNARAKRMNVFRNVGSPRLHGSQYILFDTDLRMIAQVYVRMHLS